MNWKDEFLKLYMSSDEDEIQQAINLKEQHIPQHLYRYRSASNAKYIQSELFGQIYMPHISELNDPFDSCSLLESENINNYFKPDDFVKKLKHVTNFEMPTDTLNPNTWSEDLLSYVLSAQGLNEKSKEDTIASFQSEIRRRIEKVNIQMNSAIKKDYRIACFSETPYNLPMWNHYANGHDGLCFEYDTLSFRYDSTLRQRLFPIFYQDKLPDILELMKDMKYSPISLFDYILIHKLTDWSYEKEWRLVLNFQQISQNTEDLPDDYWDTGKIEFITRPSKVYLGAKINRDVKNLLLVLCSKLKIDIYQMECTEYGLKESVVGKWKTN